MDGEDRAEHNAELVDVGAAQGRRPTTRWESFSEGEQPDSKHGCNVEDFWHRMAP
jgi:hypothetical protein